MNRILRSMAALTFVAAAPVAMFASSAIAQPISISEAGVHVVPIRSSYLAGYQVTAPGISHASVGFTIPQSSQLTCGAGYHDLAIGIGNEQTVGTPTLFVGVIFFCSDGRASAFPELVGFLGGVTQIDNTIFNNGVKIVVAQTRRKVRLSVADDDLNRVDISGPATPDNSLTFGAFPIFGDEEGNWSFAGDSGTMLTVPDFGTLRLLKPTLENVYLVDWSPTQLARANGSTLQISTSPFKPSSAFLLKFRHE